MPSANERAQYTAHMAFGQLQQELWVSKYGHSGQTGSWPPSSLWMCNAPAMRRCHRWGRADVALPHALSAHILSAALGMVCCCWPDNAACFWCRPEVDTAAAERSIAEAPTAAAAHLAKQAPRALKAKYKREEAIAVAAAEGVAGGATVTQTVAPSPPTPPSKAQINLPRRGAASGTVGV